MSKKTTEPRRVKTVTNLSRYTLNNFERAEAKTAEIKPRAAIAEIETRPGQRKQQAITVALDPDASMMTMGNPDIVVERVDHTYVERFYLSYYGALMLADMLRRAALESMATHEEEATEPSR